MTQLLIECSFKNIREELHLVLFWLEVIFLLSRVSDLYFKPFT
jgi:hypothetical protein